MWFVRGGKKCRGPRCTAKSVEVVGRFRLYCPHLWGKYSKSRLGSWLLSVVYVPLVSVMQSVKRAHLARRWERADIKGKDMPRKFNVPFQG